MEFLCILDDSDDSGQEQKHLCDIVQQRHAG